MRNRKEAPEAANQRAYAGSSPSSASPSSTGSAGSAGSANSTGSAGSANLEKTRVAASPQPSKSTSGATPREADNAARNTEWGARQLASIPIFQALSAQELQTLYSIGTIRKVRSHAHVVVEGEPSSGLFILLHGVVSVYKNDPNTGTMQRLTYLEEGANFGELSLIDRAPRSATIVAEKDCELFALSSQDFDQFLAETGPDVKARFFRRCAEDLVSRLRQQNSDYVASQQLLWRYALRREGDDHEQSPASTSMATASASKK